MKFVQAFVASTLIFCMTSAAQAQFSSFWHTSPTAKAAAAKDRLSLESAERGLNAQKGLQVEKKFVGRLPHGYKDVVTEEQRAEIYKVQEKYFESIEMLKLRLSLLEAERNHAVDDVLKADQKAKLKEAIGDLESEKSDTQLEQVATKTNDEEEDEQAEAHRYHVQAKKYASDAKKDAVAVVKETAKSESPEAKEEAAAAAKEADAAAQDVESAAKATAAGNHTAARRHSSSAIKHSKASQSHAAESRKHHTSHKKKS